MSTYNVMYNMPHLGWEVKTYKRKMSHINVKCHMEYFQGKFNPVKYRGETSFTFNPVKYRGEMSFTPYTHIVFMRNYVCMFC